MTDNQSDEERQVTLESGLEPMTDEVAILALASSPRKMPPSAQPSSPPTGGGWPPPTAPGRHCTSSTTCCPPTRTAIVPSMLSTEFRAALRDCEPTRRRDLLVDHVTAQVAAAMGLASPQLLDPSAGFFQSGMDSLMSVTLQRSLSESLGEVLPASVVFDYPTVDGLAGYLATILPELVQVAEQENADAYDDLTDDELLQQLSERLG